MKKLQGHFDTLSDNKQDQPESEDDYTPDPYSIQEFNAENTYTEVRVRVPVSIKRQLHAIADKKGSPSLSRLLVELLSNYCNAHFYKDPDFYLLKKIDEE